MDAAVMCARKGAKLTLKQQQSCHKHQNSLHCFLFDR